MENIKAFFGNIADFFRGHWQRTVLVALSVVLALVLVLLTFATTYVHHLLNMVSRPSADYDDTLPSDVLATMTEETDPTYTGEVVDPSDITLDTVDDEYEMPDSDNDGIVNILLVGQDRREGEPRQRSDSMILCTFNTNTNQITMTSFLRDTYVYIPGHGKNKMNAAYQLGGFKLLNETLAVNYGISIDANVEVNFSAFSDIIDLLGGVDIELTAAEASYMNQKKGFEYNKDEVWYLKAGVNHLTGDQALAYARIRYVSTGTGTKNDFGRTERQRTVLLTLIDAYKDQNLGDMLAMLDDILPLVTTNMTNNEILSYVGSLFPMLSNATFVTQHIPAEGTYSDKTIEGIGQCLVPNLSVNRDILKQTLYGE